MTDSERHKYNTIYEAVPSYGSTCHGQQVLNYMVDELSFEDVLDIGCGQGQLAALLRVCEKDVTGVDISDAAIASARKLCPAARFEQGSVVDMNLDRQFDLVTAFDVLEHLVEADVDKALANIGRHTKNDAVVSVAFHPDVMAGQTVHMTVQPEAWWIERFQSHFSTVTVISRKRFGAYFHLSDPCRTLP